LSCEEVAKLFQVVTNVKHRAILMTAYAGGLRVSEVIHLRVSDIDGQRMMLRVEQGKGRQDRYVMLSHKLLAVLREYWTTYKTRHWLFAGQNPTQPLTRASAHKVLGRRSLRTTQIYTHVARDYLEDTPSPLDILPDLSSGTSTKS